MAKQNLVEQTNARIKELVDNKAAELLTIQAKVTDARTQKEAAVLAIKDATEKTDLEAYDKAKAEKKAADSAIEMYSARYKMLEEKDFVTEEESDKTIDSLLAYEEELAAEYEAAIQEPLKALVKLQKEYKEAVQAAERTITKWTSTIHENHRSVGTTYANGTNRSEAPVPVHRTPYEGCNASGAMRNALGHLEQYIAKED